MKLFKQNTEDMTNLLKQLHTVKSSFRAINNVIGHCVQWKPVKGKDKLNYYYINALKPQNGEKMNLISTKIETGGHILKPNDAINIPQHNLHLLTDSVVNAQKSYFFY
jgi:hypothetical protein